MGLLDSLVERGRREGITKGREEGLRATLLRQLTTRFGPVSDAMRGRVAQCEPAELERALDRVLSANAIDEVLADH